MPVLRVLVLWHQHQPFYKDLVSGEYRLPWVRMHALKDYYGMVKLLDEFPSVHQTFNLVPSLMAQIEDYARGTAQDPFLRVAACPAADLSEEERNFALRYLFQANAEHLIRRYPRYAELLARMQSMAPGERVDRYFQVQDLTDLQVLSQLAWFDEFFLAEPEIRSLVAKGRGYSLEEQAYVMVRQKELIARVLPAHAAAARTGRIEISTSPYYHPILPLLCDNHIATAVAPGLTLPLNRFRRPEDAREQLARGLDFHERVLGLRPRGVWPSEGSVSEEVLAIASELGVEWMATDEGVLAKSLGVPFRRDSRTRLSDSAAEKLYTVHRYEKAGAAMHLIFRDQAISDLIGFVYSGMPAREAASHLISTIKESAQPVLRKGLDAVVSLILDGENAWEYYPQSGREFLRRFYDGLARDPQVEAVTASEAIARQRPPSPLRSLAPGSWIHANFNVWIGAPEDNKSWDFLYEARNFYGQAAARASEDARRMAFEELLIAEGSDWNWWYGPEHHSANDREFDELYRKHLSNVYQILGATPPDYLAQPILTGVSEPRFLPQSHYIHPRIAGDMIRYFEWMGAAHYVAQRGAGTMHGKVFLLDSIYAGIDEQFIYGRMDFAEPIPHGNFEIVVNLEFWAKSASRARRALRLTARVVDGKVTEWKLAENDHQLPTEHAAAVVARNFEFKLPLALLNAAPVQSEEDRNSPAATRILLRFSLWQNRLPLDALPVEGWMELLLLPEEELASLAHYTVGRGV